METTLRTENEKEFTSTQMAEPTVKPLSKKLGLSAIRFGEEEPWAIIIGNEVACPTKFKKLREARWEVIKNWRKYKDIRMMIIMAHIAKEEYRNIKTKSEKWERSE